MQSRMHNGACMSIPAEPGQWSAAGGVVGSRVCGVTGHCTVATTKFGHVPTSALRTPRRPVDTTVNNQQHHLNGGSNGDTSHKE